MEESLLLIVLLFLSGFFSGTEIALFSLGPEKIKALKDKAKTKTERQKITRLELLKADNQKLLVTILIGNNVVNVAASAMATVLATQFAIEQGFDENPALVIGVVTFIMTFFILMFGEIIPKAFAYKKPIKFALFATPVLILMQYILAPIIWALAGLVKKFSGNEEAQHSLSEDELKAALELSEKEGKIEHNEKEWVEKIFEFGEHSVESIMTPRSKVIAFKDDLLIAEAVKQVNDVLFSRIPIFHDDLDNTIGILTVHALLDKSLDPKFKKLKVANLRLLPPFKIPITMKIDTLLREFQIKKTHMAIVYDEHGGAVGVITLEDVLEEVFGEIEDEKDEAEITIRQNGKKSFICNAESELEHLEDFIKETLEKKAPEHFPWSYEEENKTIGLFILEALEKFPKEGEELRLEAHDEKFLMKIKKVQDEKILEIEFKILN